MTFSSDEPILVTVVTVTYNHEEYIEECLSSLVSQVTDFRYQILVGDDCSTDGTTEIVRRFAEQYPDRIVPIIREENVGSMRNFGELCSRAMAESDFMAFCDGDDYWIDDYKLQKQVDYLREHPELGGCFCNAKMLMPEGHHLMNYYKKAPDGNYYFPSSVPEFWKTQNGLYNVKNFIGNIVPAPQAVLLRVNKEMIEFPDWFWENKFLGDVPVYFFNIGDKDMFFMEECMAVYRRNMQSLTSSYATLDENFLFTRPQWVLALTGLREFYLEKYDGFAVVNIENRIKREVANYLKVLVKYDMKEEMIAFFERFPEAGKIALNAYLSFYEDSQRMTRIFTWPGYQIVARDKYFTNLLKPVVRIYMKLKNTKRKTKNFIDKKIKRSIVHVVKFFAYWLGALVPKEENLWAFSGFCKRGYMDNTKYLYEYIVENCPSLNPIWLTRDNAVYQKLKEMNYPVYKMNSLMGIWKMLRAEIAVTDHFVMSDYSAIYGYNAKTKIVQLWHGVGFKAIGDGKQVKNTDVYGVRYSNDILPEVSDTTWDRMKKKVKYFFAAPYRELFEKYFVLVCPGQERVDKIGGVWNIPEYSYLMSGSPRNIQLYSQHPNKESYDVIYAPTYRFDQNKEKAMVESCIKNFALIQETMEEINGTFTLRLHPHTWRNYKTKILNEMRKYNRLKLDEEKDVYNSLGHYSLMISDYSSISMDFAMLDRPVIFLTPDYEWYLENEAGFNVDFPNVIPGPMIETWKETLDSIKEYWKEPMKDCSFRKERTSYFFEESVNDEKNSERIVKGILKKLNRDIA